MDKEILEGNRIIAEKFMVKRLEDGKYSLVLTNAKSFIKQPQWFGEEELEFHSSWDWLMPAWKKLGSLMYEMRNSISKEEYHRANLITTHVLRAFQTVDIEYAFRWMVEGLRWYNSNQPQGGK